MENSTSVINLVSRVLEAASILPFASIWVRRKNIPHNFQYLLYYTEAKLFFYILDVISRYVFQNNVYIYHFSTVVTIFLFSQIYYKLFSSNKAKKRINVSLFLFFCVAFVDATLLNGLFVDLNSYAQAFGSIILVLIALVHILEISYTSFDLTKQPEFFLSVSVLIYFSYTIITYVASNIIYNSGYEISDTILLDRIISAPDSLLYAVHMGLLAWMFSFFPLSINPLQALPRWLHYSRWHHRPYKVLGHSSIALHHLTVA